MNEGEHWAHCCLLLLGESCFVFSKDRRMVLCAHWVLTRLACQSVSVLCSWQTSVCADTQGHGQYLFFLMIFSRFLWFFCLSLSIPIIPISKNPTRADFGFRNCGPAHFNFKEKFKLKDATVLWLRNLKSYSYSAFLLTQELNTDKYHFSKH